MKIKILYRFLSLFFFFLTIWFVFDFYYSYHKMQKTTFFLAKKQAKLAAQKIEKDVEKIMSVVNALSQSLSDGTLSYDEVPHLLNKLLEGTPEILGLGVAFVPYKYREDTRLWAPYFIRNDKGETLFSPIEKGYDYSQYSIKDPDTRWFKEGLDSPNGKWLDPYYGTVSKNYITSYVKNFYVKDPKSQSKVLAGTIIAVCSFDNMKNLLFSLDLGSTGFPILLSREGKILAHPNRSILARDLIEVAAERKDPQWVDIAKKAVGEKGEFYQEFTDSFTGKPSWVFFRPISSANNISGWKIGLVINKEELMPSLSLQGKKLLNLYLSLSCFFFFVYLSFWPIQRHKSSTWIGASFLFSLLSFLLILLVWNFAYQTEPKKGGVEIADRSALFQFIRKQEIISSKVPIYIPCGFYIQSMAFPRPDQVTLGGFIWQKYPEGFPYREGFFFPQAIGESEIKEIYRNQEKGFTVICYRFSTTLVQSFHVLKYPFDHRNISVKIVPVEIDKNILLTPDLESYSFLNPSKLPGIDEGSAPQGWSFQSSFFSYKAWAPNVSFGTSRVLEEKALPDLYFTVMLKRHFINILFSHFPPLLIVNILLFLFLLIPKKQYEVTFSLSFASFCLFILISSQTRFREAVGVSEWTYFEYFYFLMFFFVLLVVLDRMYYALNKRGAHFLLNYHENLLSKVLFWPISLGFFLLIAFLILD